MIYKNIDVYRLIEPEVLKLRNFCKKKYFKLFISNDIRLAIKLNLNGAYFPSFNRDFNHLSFKLKKEFLLIGSAHNISEIRVKNKQGIKLIFLSCSQVNKKLFQEQFSVDAYNFLLIVL